MKLQIQKFEKNIYGRDFVVGDIHGDFKKLYKKLLELNFDFDNDRLFSVGDLIDRGPESIDVLTWLTYKWFFPIFGNHEIMVYEYHNKIDWQTDYIKHGGKWFIDLNYDDKLLVLSELSKLPIGFEIETINGKFGIVHAEVPCSDWIEFKLNLADHASNAIWSFDKSHRRIKGWNKFNISNIDYVIHGHHTIETPLLIENVFQIDTNKYGHFTILEINNAEGIIAHHKDDIIWKPNTEN